MSSSDGNNLDDLLPAAYFRAYTDLSDFVLLVLEISTFFCLTVFLVCSLVKLNKSREEKSLCGNPVRGKAGHRDFVGNSKNE